MLLSLVLLSVVLSLPFHLVEFYSISIIVGLVVIVVTTIIVVHNIGTV